MPSKEAKRQTALANKIGSLPGGLAEAKQKLAGTKLGKSKIFRRVAGRILDRAHTEFVDRPGSMGTASAQNRGARGSGMSSEGQFDKGGIRLDTVTPVNSKQRGR